MNQVSKKEFLDLFDESVHDAITEAVNRYPDCEAIVCFENPDMWSSHLGERQALVVGPSNTYTLESVKGRHLNDLPSQRQYPTVYVTAEDFKKEN